MNHSRLAVIFACAFACAAPFGHTARAAESEAKAEAKTDSGPVDVELPAIFAPMVVGYRLESYAYITIAVTPAARDKILAIREKVPFLQDAFLRELNRVSIVKADDPKAVDAVAVKARLVARMRQVLPASVASDLKLEQIVMAPIGPGA